MIIFNTETQYYLFPNPSNGVVNVELGMNKSAAVIVYNSFRSMVLEAKLTAAQNNIDLSAQPSGMYPMKVQQEGGTALGKNNCVKEIAFTYTQTNRWAQQALSPIA